MNTSNSHPAKTVLVINNQNHSVQTCEQVIRALRESEAKYRNFIEKLPVMFYAAEPAPPYSPIYISPEFEVFGYPLEKWRSSANMWVSVLHPDDRDRVLRETEAAMSARRETDYEYRIIARNETVRWVRDRGRFVTDENGQIICWQGVILDITARKRTEEELRASEQRYRQMFEKNRAIKLLINAESGVIVDANPAACDFYGYSLDEFKTKKITELNTLPPEQVVAEMKRAASEKLNFFTFRHRLASGEVRDVEVHSSPLNNQSGKMLYSIIYDITERVRAESALKESEERYRQLIEQASDIIFRTDVNGYFTFVNSAAARIFDCEESEITKLHYFDLVHPAHRDAAALFYRKQFLERIPETYYEFTAVKHDGTEICIGQNVRLLLEDDRVIGFQAAARDITERVCAEEALKESEARYRDIFENANDIIYTHDLAGNYISINAAAERVFGYTREEALTMNMEQIVAPESLEIARRNLKSKLAHGAKQAVYEINCLTKTGRKITLEINSRAIYQNGKIVAVQGIARDITARRETEEALRESEAEMRALFAAMTDVIFVINSEGRYLKIAPTNLSLLYRPTEQLVGKTFHEIFEKSQADFFLEGVQRALAGRESVRLEYELTIDGKNLWFAAIVSPMLDDSVIFVARDITQRKCTEEQLKESEAKFRDLFENANDLIYTHDLAGNFTSLNRTGELITGYSREETLKMNIAQVVAPEFLESARAMTMRKIAGEPPTAYELEIIAKNGQRVTLELSTRLIYQGEKPVGVQGIARDITSRRRAEDQLLYNASHDTLTNLPNRAEFMNHLQLAVNRAERELGYRFAVLFLDLDRFKIINDGLGHIIGDKLLVQIAERLKNCVRPGDVVARLGGDEFTILLNIKENDAAIHVAERLQAELAAPFKLDAYEVFTSASIGIIVSDEVRRQPEDFLRDADTAMYRAKEAGKARYEIFNSEMHVRNMTLLQIENDLRRAIERDEFRVFYQPIVSLRTNQIREFEALLRWQHPKHGLIAPDEFISVAEETGLIVPIGRWILHEACRQTRQWQRHFAADSKRLSISVNLSAKQLMNPTLIEQIDEILADTELDAESLKLEVTESMVMEHSDVALSILTELRARGISLSTDDFGTGYSSLSYLHRFPFNRLKIDRSFVNKMDSDSKSGEIVRTILMLAESLNMEVVAEGIETERQFNLLCRLGCKLGQGFLLSKPVDPAAATQIVRENATRAFPKQPSKTVIAGVEIQTVHELSKIS